MQVSRESYQDKIGSAFKRENDQGAVAPVLGRLAANICTAPALPVAAIGYGLGKAAQSIAKAFNVTVDKNNWACKGAKVGTGVASVFTVLPLLAAAVTAGVLVIKRRLSARADQTEKNTYSYKELLTKTYKNAFILIDKALEVKQEDANAEASALRAKNLTEENPAPVGSTEVKPEEVKPEEVLALVGSTLGKDWANKLGGRSLVGLCLFSTLKGDSNFQELKQTCNAIHERVKDMAWEDMKKQYETLIEALDQKEVSEIDNIADRIKAINDTLLLVFEGFPQAPIGVADTPPLASPSALSSAPAPAASSLPDLAKIKEAKLAKFKEDWQANAKLGVDASASKEVRNECFFKNRKILSNLNNDTTISDEDFIKFMKDMNVQRDGGFLRSSPSGSNIGSLKSEIIKARPKMQHSFFNEPLSISSAPSPPQASPHVQNPTMEMTITALKQLTFKSSGVQLNDLACCTEEDAIKNAGGVFLASNKINDIMKIEIYLFKKDEVIKTEPPITITEDILFISLGDGNEVTKEQLDEVMLDVAEALQEKNIAPPKSYTMGGRHFGGVTKLFEAWKKAPIEMAITPAHMAKKLLQKAEKEWSPLTPENNANHLLNLCKNKNITDDELISFMKGKGITSLSGYFYGEFSLREEFLKERSGLQSFLEIKWSETDPNYNMKYLEHLFEDTTKTDEEVIQILNAHQIGPNSMYFLGTEGSTSLEIIFKEKRFKLYEILFTFNIEDDINIKLLLLLDLKQIPEIIKKVCQSKSVEDLNALYMKLQKIDTEKSRFCRDEIIKNLKGKKLQQYAPNIHSDVFNKKINELKHHFKDMSSASPLESEDKKYILYKSRDGKWLGIQKKENYYSKDKAAQSDMRICSINLTSENVVFDDKDKAIAESLIDTFLLGKKKEQAGALANELHKEFSQQNYVVSGYFRNTSYVLGNMQLALQKFAETGNLVNKIDAKSSQAFGGTDQPTTIEGTFLEGLKEDAHGGLQENIKAMKENSYDKNKLAVLEKVLDFIKQQ